MKPMNPVLRIPATSASIQHIFSNFTLIWNKRRNKLGIQKCAKLVFYKKGRVRVMNLSCTLACLW
jgi:hypothetical protein